MNESASLFMHCATMPKRDLARHTASLHLHHLPAMRSRMARWLKVAVRHRAHNRYYAHTPAAAVAHAPHASGSAMHILLIEDDEQLGEAIQRALMQRSYAVTWLRKGTEGAIAMRDQSADLVLLDLGLPGKDGLEVLAEARRGGIKTPVLVMTARDGLEARIRGLDLGADDYLTKPFHLEELAARIRSLTRRAQGLADSLIEAGELRLNLATSEVDFRGQQVLLTRREFALLRVLMERAGRIVRRESLENALYGLDTNVESNALEVQVHWLRRKLSPEVIQTVRGVGYMLTREPR
jgi:two-component system response regulator QseB